MDKVQLGQKLKRFCLTLIPLWASCGDRCTLKYDVIFIYIYIHIYKVTKTVYGTFAVKLRWCAIIKWGWQQVQNRYCHSQEKWMTLRKSLFITAEVSIWCVKTCPKCSSAMLPPSPNQQSFCRHGARSYVLEYSSLWGKSCCSSDDFSVNLIVILLSNIQLLSVLRRKPQTVVFFLQNDSMCMNMPTFVMVQAFQQSTQPSPGLLAQDKLEAITWGKQHGG